MKLFTAVCYTLRTIVSFETYPLYLHLPGLVDSYNVVRLYLLFSLSGHKSVGCYELDGTSRLTHELTGSDPILNGIYPAQPGSFISKCAVAVIRAGYRLFAVENNDTCSANATTPQKIKKLKESKKCGLGDANAFQVYNIRGNFKVRAQSRSPFQH